MEAKFHNYRDQAINTMTQGELLLLVYDELVLRLTRAELALDKQIWEVYDVSVQRAIDIVNYLDETLDLQYDISASLKKLYEYFTYELGRAKIGRNRTVLTQVKTMAAELRDTFRVAQQNNDSGK